MKYPNEIPARVDIHLREYDQRNPAEAVKLRARKVEIINTILQDHPEAIAELENDGWIQKKQ